MSFISFESANIITDSPMATTSSTASGHVADLFRLWCWVYKDLLQIFTYFRRENLGTVVENVPIKDIVFVFPFLFDRWWNW